MYLQYCKGGGTDGCAKAVAQKRNALYNIRNLMTLAEEIKQFFKGEVDDNDAARDQMSRDASLFHITPAVVVRPRDAEDVEKLVAFVAAAKKAGRNLSLTARAAGTDMTGGPLTESIVVDFLPHFNHLKEIGPDFAVTEPGVFYRDFEKETLKTGLILPSYPASRELAAMGGIVNNNSGGEKTLKYGKTERYIEEIQLVLSDGNLCTFKKLTEAELEEKKKLQTLEGKIYRDMSALIFDNQKLLTEAKPNVTKNSSGYFLWNVWDPAARTFDLTKMIVGAQGTLGLMLDAKLRLIRLKPVTRLLVVFLKDTKDIARIAEKVLVYDPESFESYDNNTFKLAMKFFPEMMERVKGNLLKMALGLMPEMWMLLQGGIPKLVLLVEFAGDTAAEAHDAAKKLEKELKKDFGVKTRVTATDEETKEFWVIRRESFNLLRHHVKGLRTAPFIDDFSVRAELLPEFLPKLYEILGRYKLLYTIAGHVGDGNFHIIPLMDMTNPKSKEVITTLSKEVYDLVLKFKGSITSEHNDGLIRTPFLRQEFGDAVYALFEKTKAIFDPDNIFNPGKKVGGTLEYSLARIDTEKKS